jgi:HPt (histidine-containing phosphotransfer) domain-containing protein
MLNRPIQAFAPDAGTAGGAGAPASVLDPVALSRLAELDPGGANRLLERVLQAFLTSLTRLRPQLAGGRASGDRAAVRLVTHTLKSSSASIGAMRLSQLCAEIETAIRLDPAADLDERLDALDVALDDTVLAIEFQMRGPG